MKSHSDIEDLSTKHFNQAQAIIELENANFTQSSVRKITGDTRDRISRLFTGKTEFTATDALRLSMLLDKDIREFMTEELPG